MSKQTIAGDEFLITDPENHPGVVLEVPEGMEALRLEPIGYHAETEVRCAFCRNRQKHNYGFFAVLTDESLALCGNCCAEKIAGKSTVAKIKRDVKRREKVAAASKEIDPLALGLAPIIEILERDWLSTEKEIHRNVRRLNRCFFSVKTPKMAKLYGAFRGLQDIVSATSSGPVIVADIKGKRSRALDMISEGVLELRGELEKLDLDKVRRLVDHDDLVHGYYRTELHGRSLYLIDTPSWMDPQTHDSHMDVHMTLPKIHLPDKGPLMQAVEAAKLVTV